MYYQTYCMATEDKKIIEKMSEDELLVLISERLKGRILFPERHEAAKKLVKNMKFKTT